jgi:hypothetical protein
LLWLYLLKELNGKQRLGGGMIQIEVVCDPSRCRWMLSLPPNHNAASPHINSKNIEIHLGPKYITLSNKKGNGLDRN